MTASQGQLRRLAASIEAAREQERAALARELHDELGQTLTAIKMELGRATEILQREPVKPEAMDRLQSLVGLVDIGVTTVKRIATNLRPPALDHLGLAEAVRWEAAAFARRSRLRTQVAAEDDGTRLSPAQQTALFRIFQEALTNIGRHAHASAVRVRLSVARGVFELRVSDNGRGITAAERTHAASIGLLGMHERAAQARGTLHIEGSRGRGTVVTVRVPLTPPLAAARTRPAR